MKKAGRPMKYAAFIKALDDESLYTPATIVANGVEKNLFEPKAGIFPRLSNPEEFTAAKLKVRHALARLSSNHDFPAVGDGLVVIKGQALIPGWTGKRWKSAIQ